MRKIAIFDTTLRDGEQSPGARMMPDDKLVIARQLLRLNVDVIEAGFPASSPEDFRSVQAVAELAGDRAVVCALSRAVPADIEAAARALAGAARPRIHTGIGVSPVHLRDKLGVSEDECLRRIERAVAYARRFVDDVQFYAEDAGRSDYGFLVRALQVAIDSGATVLNLPETTGYSLPDEFGHRVGYVMEHVRGVCDVTLAVHCHNDLGLATALSLAGVRAGATQVECTVNGIGERAGNTALEEVVMALALHGEELDACTGIETRELAKASRLVSNITGMKVQANKAIVGRNAFAHASGIHQDGVLKARSTYEIIDPASVGAGNTRIVLTARSGHAALGERLHELGYAFDAAELDELYAAFLQMADKKKEVFDEDLESLVNERERVADAFFTLQGLQISCGFPLIPTATLTLADAAGKTHRVCTCGTGPIDAAYKAIDEIVGTQVELADFTVQSITGGMDALGEVTVRVRAHDGRIFIGRGADGDIIVASAKAYLNALNRLLGQDSTSL